MPLKQSNKNYFQNILDALPQMVLVKGPLSKIVWANKSFCEFYGMSNQQLHDLIDAPFNNPDFTQQYIKDDAQVFETGQTLIISAEPVKRHDGELRYFNTVKSAIFDKHGKVIMTVGISNDVTDHIAAEKLIEDQRSQIFASEKLSSLGEMAGNIAHEINNPLAVILARAELLKEQAETSNLNKEEVKDTAEKIVSTTLRISKIVRALRSVTRDGAADPFTSVSISLIVQETIELCTQRFKSNGVELIIEMPPQDLTAQCRSVQISQVLLNLLNNAYDAVENIKEKWVHLKILDRNPNLILEVMDSGHGIAPAIQKKIMEPFFTTKEVGRGTGLGLSVSRSILHDHQGTLELDTNSTHTKFVITLPKTRC